MTRREFVCLVIGLFSGVMIKPADPIVKIPDRPHIGPLPLPKPTMPTRLAIDNEEVNFW